PTLLTSARSSTLSLPPPPNSTLSPYTTLFRSFAKMLQNISVSFPDPGEIVIRHRRWRLHHARHVFSIRCLSDTCQLLSVIRPRLDRKSTRLNSSHVSSSYAVFCLKKKTALFHK